MWNILVLHMDKNSEDHAEFLLRLEECALICGSINALARRAGINTATIQPFFKTREPRRTHLIAISRAAGVNLTWLAEGVGPQHRVDKEVPQGLAAPNGQEVQFVPVHGIHASSGFGAHVFEEDEEPERYIAFPIPWLRSFSSGQLDKLSIITNVGTSNEPEIMDGDMVMVDRAATEVMTEGKYAVAKDGTLQLKRIKKVSPSLWELVSVNPAYPPEQVNLEEWGDRFRVIGKVVWVSRRT